MDSYCSVYFTETLQMPYLLRELMKRIGGKIIHRNSIEIELGRLSISENKAYNEYLQYQFPDGFLYFKFKMEINFKQNVQISQCINVVSQILTIFWDSNTPAVAAADYEQFLPLKGGYNSIGIPWPKSEINNQN